MPTHDPAVDAWLDALPPDRRAALGPVLATIREHMPPGYAETMTWGMPTWEVPLSVYPDTYNKKPLMYAAMASQKGHMAVYLMGIYALPELRARFEAEWAAAGKKLDAGGSCVRFRKLDAVPLDVIGRAVAATPMDAYVAHAKAVRAQGPVKRSASKKGDAT